MTALRHRAVKRRPRQTVLLIRIGSIPETRGKFREKIQMRDAKERRKLWLVEEGYRVFDWLLESCQNEIEGTGWQMTDILHHAVQEEAERRFLMHLMQLFFNPAAWDVHPATTQQIAALTAEQRDEARTLFVNSLDRIWKERAEHFDCAMEALVASGQIKVFTGEDGERYIAPCKPN
jgi:hypothetical protein